MQRGRKRAANQYNSSYSFSPDARPACTVEGKKGKDWEGKEKKDTIVSVGGMRELDVVFFHAVSNCCVTTESITPDL